LLKYLYQSSKAGSTRTTENDYEKIYKQTLKVCWLKLISL